MLKYIRFSRSKRKERIDWTYASDIEKRIKYLIDSLQIDWITKTRVFCFRSKNAKTRAYARIWGLGRIWQIALSIQPAYVIEVISEKFDNLNQTEKDKVLLHEIAHIPQNFSGSLLPHIRRGKRRFEDRVNSLVVRYLKSR